MNVLLFVVGTEIINGNVFLVAEPLVSTTGIANDESEYSGKLYAVSDRTSRAIGCTEISLTLFEDFGLRWKLEGGEIPAGQFFLSDESSLEVCFDEIVSWSPSDLFRHRLNQSEWQAYPIKIGERLGVVCPEIDCKLGTNRMLILDGAGELSGNVELTEIDDSEEILGYAKLPTQFAVSQAKLRQA